MITLKERREFARKVYRLSKQLPKFNTTATVDDVGQALHDLVIEKAPDFGVVLFPGSIIEIYGIPIDQMAKLIYDMRIKNIVDNRPSIRLIRSD